MRGALLHTSYTISCSYRGTPCRLSCQGARVSAPAEHGMHNKRVSRRSLTRCALHVPTCVLATIPRYFTAPWLARVHAVAPKLTEEVGVLSVAWADSTGTPRPASGHRVVVWQFRALWGHSTASGQSC